MNKLQNSKKLYWWLIGTFFILYALVGFVSTLHSITFFGLANATWLAVMLGITYEVGQAAVLFSILMSKNKNNFLPWGLMILLTALQVTANVYASFKFMDGSGSNDWTYWQRSILFWLEVDGPEMFKVIISWITGALLPVVALGMTALVAENIKHQEKLDEEKEIPTPIEAKDVISEVSRFRPTEDDLKWAESILADKTPVKKDDEPKKEIQVEKTKPVNDNIRVEVLTPSNKEEITKKWDESGLLDGLNAKNEGVPEISNEDLADDELEDNDFEAHLEEETSLLTPDLEPHVEEDPVIESKVEPVVDPQVKTVVEAPKENVTHTNGLVDIVPSKEESIKPMTRDPLPDAQEINLDEAKQREEEEKRLERLREIAREKLKKK